MNDELQLIEPKVELETEYRAFLAEFAPLDQADQLDWSSGCAPNWDCFASLVRRLKDATGGIGLSDGQIPHTTYWLIRGEQLVGTCNLRHWRRETKEDFFGHIGYCVRPSERRKGYGTRMLAMCMQRIAKMGIEQAILTCRDDNLGSIGVIENNGGRLLSKSYPSKSQCMARRYSVPTSSD